MLAAAVFSAASAADSASARRRRHRRRRDGVRPLAGRVVRGLPAMDRGLRARQQPDRRHHRRAMRRQAGRRGLVPGVLRTAPRRSCAPAPCPPARPCSCPSSARCSGRTASCRTAAAMARLAADAVSRVSRLAMAIDGRPGGTSSATHRPSHRRLLRPRRPHGLALDHQGGRGRRLLRNAAAAAPGAAHDRGGRAHRQHAAVDHLPPRRALKRPTSLRGRSHLLRTPTSGAFSAAAPHAQGH